MTLPIFSRFLGVAAFAATFLPPALVAQQELQYSIAGSVLIRDPKGTPAELTRVADGLQIRALERDTVAQSLCVLAPLAAAQLGGRSMPPRQNFELIRVVVRFRIPTPASASLGSVQLTSEFGTPLLNVMTMSKGGRSPFEAQPPNRIPPTTVNTHTLLRLAIDSPLPLDAPGPDSPDPNFKYKGEPFVLNSVDIYVKNPLQVTGPRTKPATTGAGAAPAPAQPAPAKPAPAKTIPNLPG